MVYILFLSHPWMYTQGVHSPLFPPRRYTQGVHHYSHPGRHHGGYLTLFSTREAPRWVYSSFFNQEGTTVGIFFLFLPREAPRWVYPLSTPREAPRWV